MSKTINKIKTTQKDDDNCFQIVLDYVQKQVHNKAEILEEILVKETYKNELVWQGKVFVFLLKGHPKTDKCYAWYSDNPDTGKRKLYAVLHLPPVDSPEKAVRAAIVQDYRSG